MSCYIVIKTDNLRYSQLGKADAIVDRKGRAGQVGTFFTKSHIVYHSMVHNSHILYNKLYTIRLISMSGLQRYLALPHSLNSQGASPQKRFDKMLTQTLTLMLTLILVYWGRPSISWRGTYLQEDRK